MKITERMTRLVIAVILIVGTLALFFVLAVHEIPDGNREMVLSLLGAWALGLGLMLKRLFEGSDSSDQKNQIMQSQADALASKPADPAAGPPGAA